MSFIHSFIRHFNASYVSVTGLEAGCSVCTPTVPALRELTVQGQRQAHQEAVRRHHGDSVLELCVGQHGRSKERDLSQPRGGAEARGHFLNEGGEA